VLRVVSSRFGVKTTGKTGSRRKAILQKNDAPARAGIGGASTVRFLGGKWQKKNNGKNKVNRISLLNESAIYHSSIASSIVCSGLPVSVQRRASENRQSRSHPLLLRWSMVDFDGTTIRDRCTRRRRRLVTFPGQCGSACVVGSVAMARLTEASHFKVSWRITSAGLAA
jgi:hypothetical protein